MEEIAEEQSYSKMEWFFYIIFIPLLFTLVLSAIIAQMFGYNVVGMLAKGLNQVPVVEKLIPDSAAPNSKKTTQTETTPAKSDARVSDLQKQLDLKNKEIDKLKQKQQEEKKMQDQAQQATSAQTTAAQASQQKATEERLKEMKQLAKIYTAMSAGKAAPIFEKMPPEEAANLLQVMKPEDRSSIMAKMNPKKAADMTVLIQKMSLGQMPDATPEAQAAIQNEIKIVKNNASAEEVAASIATMQPASAAVLVENLFRTDEQKALAVMRNMDQQKRGDILSSITNDLKKGALAAKISQKLMAY
ncbi:flagellar motility protein MotE (MotC chaperone) [Aneurinibacillus soli]|uniref:MgtE intracellular N domain protein n=1 Tax=Aneurinibacillus soli TaxID=1500254 RepID=A0A0U5BBV2_9BACL|nr:hypothetical protein [Aneurinibacillus soli]PYE63397.1 flagellar motility protein MotE (MotC chaperone) [Aneurinibacillus soli]BAU27671.1 MgtE intracellular N domain protein [Aneurinibacillus soli]